MSLVLLPRPFHVNSAGQPYPFAKLYHYRATTTTTLNLYTTRTFGVPHANPVVADANGIFPAMYVNPSDGYNLRLQLKDQNDVLIYDEDEIERVPSIFGDISASGSALIVGQVEADGGLLTFGNIEERSANPRVILYETDKGTDLKRWDIDVQDGILSVRTRTDADGAGKNILKVTRGTTTAVSIIEVGNATDVPAFYVNGDPWYLTGSFTATFTGMTGATTGTLYYKRAGHLVTIHARSAIFGTSNSTAMTITGIPAALMPSNVSTYPFTVPSSLFLDSSANVSGTVTSLSTTSVTLGSGSTGATNNWTAANGKGVSAGWTATWPVMG